MSSNWKAYNPRTIQSDGHWYAMCTIEEPNGETSHVYHAGSSEMQATILLQQVVTFLYDVNISAHRVG